MRTNRWIQFLTPRRIDYYILSEVIGPFMGGILFFCFVFLMFQALRLADFFIIHGISGLLLLKMIGLLVLSFMPTALPIAFLIGILIAFGRLSNDSELVAMKANGISLYRITLPVVVLSITVSVISLALNMEWVPWVDRTFKSTLIKVSNTKVVTSIREGTFTAGFFDLLLFTDHVDKKTGKLHRVFIFDEREPKNPLIVVAREGEIISVHTQSEFGTAAVLKLTDGNIHRNDTANNTYSKIDFRDYKLFLKVDEGGDTSVVKPRMIPSDELILQIEREKVPRRKLELTGEYWRRFAVAITPIIFVFLGIGFGTVRTRAVRAGAALIALVVIAIYWGIQAWAAVGIQEGHLLPALGMQLPNLVMLIAAIKGFRSALW